MLAQVQVKGTLSLTHSFDTRFKVNPIKLGIRIKHLSAIYESRYIECSIYICDSKR